MPLPAKVKRKEAGIWLLEDGRYLVDVRSTDQRGKKRRGRGIRKTIGEAKRLKAKTITLPPKKKEDKDNRLLSELIEEWDKFYGKNLFDGKGRKSKLMNQCDALKNPVANEISSDTYQDYLDGRDGISANTLNHDLAYMKAMFNRLIKLEKWNLPNPVSCLSPIPVKQSEITYLEKKQIKLLPESLGGLPVSDASMISKICLATGCRWGEAESLRPEQIQGNAIHFAETKNSKARLVPIAETFRSKIIKYIRPTGRLFKLAYKDFGIGLKKSGIKLPKGQRTHVLRHSFSVHFMRHRGNILDLQKILGHKTLQMTLRYAQYHPDYLADAPTKNPIADLL